MSVDWVNSNAQELWKRSSMDCSLVWLRRDLRLEDVPCMEAARKKGLPVYVLFVLDTRILEKLPSSDRRVSFIVKALESLQGQLRQRDSDLICVYGDAINVVPWCAKVLGASNVYAGEDYEGAARARDNEVKRALEQEGRVLHLVQDHMLMPSEGLRAQNGNVFTVYSAYAKKWLEQCAWSHLDPLPSERCTFVPWRGEDVFKEAQIGFSEAPLPSALGYDTASAKRLFEFFLAKKIETYHTQRDFPALGAGSYLGVHNRFGTLSVRYLVRRTLEVMHKTSYLTLSANGFSPKELLQLKESGAGVWLSEIVWRDFYFYILKHFPFVEERAFNPKHQSLPWENNEELWSAWSGGRTGYPIVDAAVKQLLSTGYMHNRLRMVCASFLTKHLLCDYRKGEAFFAQHLLDFDLSANNGGWQWSASTGVDAQPYFRIFNPISQSERFDPKGVFIKRWLPELSKVSEKYIHAPWLMSEKEQKECGCVLGVDYPLPIVEHTEARQKALDFFKAAGG